MNRLITRICNKNFCNKKKELEKEEQTKPKVSTRKEIINITAEISEIARRPIFTSPQGSWVLPKEANPES